MHVLPFYSVRRSKFKLVPIIIALVITGISCTSNKRLARQEMAATFQSYPNGVADIELVLNPNGRFVLDLTTLPDPAEEQEETEKSKMKGKWNAKESDYELHFRGRNTPDLVALVGIDYSPETNISVIDERTLIIPGDQREIVIWGVKCFKK
jgi:hypothetical protein